MPFNHIALGGVKLGNNFLMWLCFNVYCFAARKPQKEELGSGNESFKWKVKRTFPEMNCDSEIMLFYFSWASNPSSLSIDPCIFIGLKWKETMSFWNDSVSNNSTVSLCNYWIGLWAHCLRGVTWWSCKGIVVNYFQKVFRECPEDHLSPCWLKCCLRSKRTLSIIWGWHFRIERHWEWQQVYFKNGQQSQIQINRIL